VKFMELDRATGMSILVVTSSPGGSYSNWWVWGLTFLLFMMRRDLSSHVFYCTVTIDVSIRWCSMVSFNASLLELCFCFSFLSYTYVPPVVQCRPRSISNHDSHINPDVRNINARQSAIILQRSLWCRCRSEYRFQFTVYSFDCGHFCDWVWIVGEC
jgi:hypothetical protein